MALRAIIRAERHLAVMTAAAVLALAHLGHCHLARTRLHFEEFFVAIRAPEHGRMELMAEDHRLHPASGIFHVFLEPFHVVALRAFA